MIDDPAVEQAMKTGYGPGHEPKIWTGQVQVLITLDVDVGPTDGYCDAAQARVGVERDVDAAITAVCVDALKRKERSFLSDVVDIDAIATREHEDELWIEDDNAA